jgi:hypothetical protein
MNWRVEKERGDERSGKDPDPHASPTLVQKINVNLIPRRFILQREMRRGGRSGSRIL